MVLEQLGLDKAIIPGVGTVDTSVNTAVGLGLGIAMIVGVGKGVQMLFDSEVVQNLASETGQTIEGVA